MGKRAVSEEGARGSEGGARRRDGGVRVCMHDTMMRDGRLGFDRYGRREDRVSGC